MQAADVKFSQDLTHQKSLKSVNFWQSYLKNKNVDVFWYTVTLKAQMFRILKLILVKECLNVANEEKFTILGGKLFQTFTPRSLKSFSACWCDILSSSPTNSLLTFVHLLTRFNTVAPCTARMQRPQSTPAQWAPECELITGFNSALIDLFLYGRLNARTAV